MFVGTIHSYCFRLLQQHVPRYETFDVLDDNRLTAFLTREANRIGIKQLDGSLFKSIRTFLTNLDVIENELLEPHHLDDPLREIYEQLPDCPRGQPVPHLRTAYRPSVSPNSDEPDVFAAVHDPSAT